MIGGIFRVALVLAIIALVTVAAVLARLVVRRGGVRRGVQVARARGR